jgi:hypothetical protein
MELLINYPLGFHGVVPEKGTNLYLTFTLTITIGTKAKLPHDFHKFSGSENVSITRRSTKFAIKVGKMRKFTKMQFR